MSADGNTIVGDSHSANGTEAFRYIVGGSGIAGLGDLSGGVFGSVAYAVNSGVIVGHGRSTSSGNGAEAFRHTSGGGMVGLGDLAGGGFSSTANGVSGDGSIIVGLSASANGAEAFIWDETSNAMQSIRDGLIGDGFDLTGWTNLTEAFAISADGSTVVGYGRHNGNNEAFYARIDTSPVPVPAAVWLMGSALAGLFGFGRKKNLS